jgi:hypothetical protein
MTQIIRIPIKSYNERIEIIKRLRAELGPLGSAWSFVTNRSMLEISIRYPEQSAILTFLVLKYGNTILS